ncbi:MAG TPA: glycosyltransferase [Thermoleophilaceae bacterium]
MRITIFDAYYVDVLERLYAETPGLDRRPYDDQLTAIMGLYFGTSDAYSRPLRELGHEAHDVVLNWPPVQRAWARDHRAARLLRGLSRLPSLPGRVLPLPLLHAVARAQLESLDSEVVYLQYLSFFSEREIRRMKAEGRYIVGQLGSQPPSDGRVGLCDLVLTSFPHFVPRLRAQGIDCEYFPLAFFERVLDRLRAEGLACDPIADERDIPAAFAGGIHPPHVHRSGTALLERLARETPAEFWGYVHDELAPDSAIRSRHHGEAWGLDMYRVLARSGIAVNRHGDIAEDYANNMRLFEATGVGALLVTEAARNLPGLFTPGEEIVTYDSAEDLVEKVRHYTEHPDERRAIAAAGQRRTLAEHTYRHRMEQLDALLRARLP